MKQLTELDWLRIAYEMRAYVASDWMRSAMIAELTYLRSRATAEERDRITHVIRTEAKLHRAKHARPGFGMGDFLALFDGMERPAPAARPHNLFERKGTRRRRLPRLTERDWANLPLLAEALEAVEFMRDAQAAELDGYRERGTSEDRERITKLLRAAQRAILEDWGHPSAACGAVGESLRGAGRAGWWTELDGVANATERRAQRHEQEHDEGAVSSSHTKDGEAQE